MTRDTYRLERQAAVEPAKKTTKNKQTNRTTYIPVTPDTYPFEMPLLKLCRNLKHGIHAPRWSHVPLGDVDATTGTCKKITTTKANKQQNKTKQKKPARKVKKQIILAAPTGACKNNNDNKSNNQAKQDLHVMVHQQSITTTKTNNQT